MSITSDLRSYADKAAASAQAQLNDVTGQANVYVGKAKENLSVLTDKAGTVATDLRAQAEKTINVEAIKAAVEPYLAQAKGYRATATDRAEAVLSTLKQDKRVAKVVDAAKPVLDSVQERVVKPVRSLAGRAPVGKPAPKPAAKPAATKPAPAKATTRKAPAKRTTKA